MCEYIYMYIYVYISLPLLHLMAFSQVHALESP